MITVTQVYGVPRNNQQLGEQVGKMEALVYDNGELDMLGLVQTGSSVAVVGGNVQRTLTYEPSDLRFELENPTPADQLAAVENLFTARFALLMIAISASCSTVIS